MNWVEFQMSRHTIRVYIEMTQTMSPVVMNLRFLRLTLTPINVTLCDAIERMTFRCLATPP